MGRISQPTRELIEMYNMDTDFMDDSSTFHEINRAYQRVDGKFQPIGWAVDAFLIDRNRLGLRVYTDEQVRQYQIKKYSFNS